MSVVSEWFLALWQILVATGPWLIIGFLAAGAAFALIPEGGIARFLRGKGVKPVAKATLLGLPLPLCSCSVIPAAAQIRASGASKGASAAFAISTPETGEESIALTWGTLGPAAAVTRPASALISAFTAGVLIDRFVPEQARETSSKTTSLPIASCCSTEPAPAPAAPACCSDDAASQPEADSCCSSVATPAASEDACCSPPDRRRDSFGQKLASGLRHGMITMPRHLAVWLVIGLALAATIEMLIPDGWIENNIGGGIGPMLIMLVVGLPTYVCATSSTPVAAGLVAKGLSPGAALVFLLAGPATNTATMAWVVRDLGWRALVIYLGAIASVALATGLLFDALVPISWSRSVASGMAHEHSLFSQIAAGLTAALLLTALVGKLIEVLRPRLHRGRPRRPDAAPTPAHSAS